MIVVLFLITVLFAGIGFSSSHAPLALLHPVSTYFVTILTALRNNFFMSVLAVMVLVGWLYYRIRTKQFFLIKWIMVCSHAVALIFLGCCFSYVLLFFIALLHLNIFSIFLSTNGKTLGIISDKSAIVSEMVKASDAPTIVTAGPSAFNRLVALAQTTSGNDNFYGDTVLSSIPSFLVIPQSGSTSSLMFLDNTLILSGVSAADLYTISPVLGHTFVQKYFWNRRIASYPQITFMNADEYKRQRETQVQEKLKKIEITIQELDGQISSLSAAIKTGNEFITSQKDAIKTGLVSKNEDYKACLLIQKNSSACVQAVATEDAKLTEMATDVATTTKQLAVQKEQITIYTTYEKILASQKVVMQTLSANIPHELGVFEPKKSIRIVFDTQHVLSIADYLETLSHEYLHYASFISKDQEFSNAFFEEGLTEYFARNIIQQELGVSTNLGYPVQVKIISEMTKLIPEGELADIYFSKDEDALARTLDRVYGDQFYETNAILFESLQYSSSPQETLKIANQIMKKIGGKPLTMEDLSSSYTH